MSHTYVSDLVIAFFPPRNAGIQFRQKRNPNSGHLSGELPGRTFKALIVGGTENHVHILLSLPATVPLAKAVQLMKGSSSRWMNETHTKGFSWQEGYGAFTLGVSQRPRTIDYIKRQAEHHLKRSFEEEFVAFLKKHAIDYDPKHVWG